MQHQEDEAARTALTAALERGDASVRKLPDGYIGVKVMGQQLARIHHSRVSAPVDN